MNEPEIVFWSHYIDEKNTPLFAFGHGLSYGTTGLGWGDGSQNNDTLTLDATQANAQVQFVISAENISGMAHSETIQLYTHQRSAKQRVNLVAHALPLCMKARTRPASGGRNSRPRRISNTSRGSPATSRPNLVGGMSFCLRKISISRPMFTICSPF